MSTNYFKVKKGLNLDSTTAASTASAEGDVNWDGTNHKIEYKDNSAIRKVVSEDGTQTLTNKTLSGNTATNLVSGSGTLTLNTTGTVTVPNATDTLVGKATTDTLTNKTFDAQGTGNTLSNITDTNIKAAAGIVDTKLATISTAGKVSNSATTATSANTASTIVARDGSNNFSAGTITAALTGTASGNTTYSANNHGVVLSSATNAMTVVAPNASTVFPLVSGGSSTDPGWAALTAGGGGTGQTSYTKGDTLVASAATTINKLPVGTDGQVVVADSSQSNGLKWATLQQGAKNYITYNNFENNATTGWSLANSALTSNFPSTVGSGGNSFSSAGGVHGGGAASGNLSIASSNSSPLAGGFSLAYASSAATTAGDMLVSQSYTIDSEDQAKVLSFKFFYTPSSNPSNGNWSGTSSNSFGVAIYDLANNAWIMPAGVWNFVQSSGIGVCQGTFQTPSNMTGFQLAVFNANVTTGAITVKFDDFYVGPQSLAFGPAVTDMVQYTPTITGFGTPTNVSFWSKRVGDSLIVQGYFTSGTSTATQAQITLGYNGVNTNVTVDSTKIAQLSLVGYGSVNSVNTDQWQIYANGGQNYVTFGRQGTNAGLTNLNGSSVISTGVSLSFFAEVFISGWSSNTAMSADTDTRVVAASLQKSVGQSITQNSATVITFDTVVGDTHGVWSTSNNNYTAPISGWYEFYGSLFENGSTTAGTGTIGLSKNGTTPAWNVEATRQSTVNGVGMPYSFLVQANAGDTFQLKYNLSTASPNVGGNNSANGISSLNIKRVSGPAVVAASETVAMYAGPQGGLGGTLSGSYNVAKFATINKDTHNAYNIGTGFYTVPITGYYSVTANLDIQGTYVAGAYSGCRIGNSTTGIYFYSFTRAYGSVTTDFNTGTAAGVVYCNAGDIIETDSITQATGSPTFSTSLGESYMSICRIK